MKRLFKLSVVVVIVLISTQTWAQEKGKIRLGAGLAMGTKAAIDDTGSNKLGFGLNFSGDYFITDVISIYPSYTSFFKSKVTQSGTDVSLQLSSFNIDGKYYFLTNGVNVYGLIGISFASIKSTVSFLGTPVDLSASETGLNIGAGVDYSVSDKIYLNGQVGYNTPADHFVINVGVGYVIN